MKDEQMKVKLIQRTERIYSCRDMTEDKEKFFNFGVQSSLKFEFWKTRTGVRERHYIFSLPILVESYYYYKIDPNDNSC